MCQLQMPSTAQLFDHKNNTYKHINVPVPGICCDNAIVGPTCCRKVAAASSSTAVPMTHIECETPSTHQAKSISELFKPEKVKCISARQVCTAELQGYAGIHAWICLTHVRKEV